MEWTSDNWKNAHKRIILNESFVEISFDVSDPIAQQDATASDNGAIYTSNSSQVTTGWLRAWRENGLPPFPGFCTLEQNCWVLNGKREILTGGNDLLRWYEGDVLSDETCSFSEKIPTITLEFNEEFSSLIPGITITWSTSYGEYATNFIVKAYDKDMKLVAEKEVLDNHSVESRVLMDIVGYKYITIYVKKWCLPHHRVRVEDILIGINKVYSKADLFSFSHKQSVSPISTSLPKNEIQISVNNVDGEYNPYNENGMAKYLMERQEVKVRYGLKMNDGTIEWIKGGTFYLSEWYAKQNGLTADFTARDSIDLLAAIPVKEENFESSEGRRSLYAIAEDLLTTARDNYGLPIIWFTDIDRQKTTTATLPNDTLANCLQLIANAGECVIRQNRNGVILIEPIEDEEVDYSINTFNSYSKSEISLSKPLKQVDVKVYTYTKTDDGKIEGAVTDTKSVIVGTTGETIVVDNPLITSVDRAESVGNWMANYLKRRMTLNSSWRADVSLDALDTVTNENAYNTNKVLMTDVEFKYNGAFRGTGEGKVMGNG